MAFREMVSVVIPAFKAAAIIEEAIISVREQDYRPLEVVVVEDCSPDETAEIVERLAGLWNEAGFEIRLLRQPENRGGAAALSRGFREARGSYLCWLSADDAFVGAVKLSSQVQQLDSGAALSYSRSFYQGSTLGGAVSAGAVVAHWHPRIPMLDTLLLRRPRARLLSLLFVNPINGSTVMVRRTAWERYGDFDPSLRNIDQDGDMWLRYSALGAEFAMLEVPCGFYRVHPGQTSSLQEDCIVGAAATRIRLVMAYEQSGLLARLLSTALPMLAILAITGTGRSRPIVARYLCEAGLRSSNHPILRYCLRRMLGGLDQPSRSQTELAGRAIALATKTYTSVRFSEFVERLVPS